jgi:hypothetical protein
LQQRCFECAAKNNPLMRARLMSTSLQGGDVASGTRDAMHPLIQPAKPYRLCCMLHSIWVGTSEPPGLYLPPIRLDALANHRRPNAVFKFQAFGRRL